MKTMKYLSMFYTVVKILIAILLLIAFCVPIYLAVQWCKKNNKIIKIYPKFEIVDVVNEKEIDIDSAKEAVRISKEILQKIK